jgi:hypothetical protein
MTDQWATIYVLVTGSRAWGNVDQLRATLDRVIALAPRSRVVLFHGACPTGADRLANEWAIQQDIEVRRFPAEEHGPWPRCGPMRNTAMVKSFADEVNGTRANYMVFAFRSPGKSSGTDDCVAKCRRAGLVVAYVHEETPSV